MLVFSVTPYQDKNENRSEPRKKAKYALTKIQITAIFSSVSYPEKCFSQVYRDLYGDAMLVPICMGTNMVAGNQQKHLSLSFDGKA